MNLRGTIYVIASCSSRARVSWNASTPLYALKWICMYLLTLSKDTCSEFCGSDGVLQSLTIR